MNGWKSTSVVLPGSPQDNQQNWIDEDRNDGNQNTVAVKKNWLEKSRKQTTQFTYVKTDSWKQENGQNA